MSCWVLRSQSVLLDSAPLSFCCRLTDINGLDDARVLLVLALRSHLLQYVRARFLRSFAPLAVEI